MVNEVKKINVNYEIINDENICCNTQGILKNSEIIFYDNKVKNRIKVMENKVIVERTLDYFLKLEFIMGKMTKGTYTIGDVGYEIEIFTKELKIRKNEILIIYYLMGDKNNEFRIKISYEIFE